MVADGGSVDRNNGTTSANGRVTGVNDVNGHTRHHYRSHTRFNGYVNGLASSSNASSGNGIPGSGQGCDNNAESVAIVGMACQFAGGANGPSGLWDMCAGNRSGWAHHVPESRFDAESAGVSGGYFLDRDIGLFDAGFFGLSAEEASSTDPQLRLLLECVYEALEDAGIPLHKVSGSDTAVYTATSGSDYHELQMRDPDASRGTTAATRTRADRGTSANMFSTQISRFYGMQGPSMTIDVGDAGALAALHQARCSLLAGDCEMAIVAGASVILNPELYHLRGTRSHARGEGVACVLLKRLDAALRDEDRVHAVVRESGLNQQGGGMVSSSADAQARLIEQCYRRAGLDMAETAYVEAHMTGVKEDDVAEAEALARTFGKAAAGSLYNGDERVLVGSVKDNVGNTEAVSGLAAIIKAACAIQKRQIPPNRDYDDMSGTEFPFPLDEWNLDFPKTLTPWPVNKPLRVSIHSFGNGGENAHAILEAVHEVPNNDTLQVITQGKQRERVFVLSAGDQAALRITVSRLAAHVRSNYEHCKDKDDEERVLRDLAYTLSERRSRLLCMAAVRASSLSELADRLDEKASSLAASDKNNDSTNSNVTKTKTNNPPRIGFVFNGQGAQWHAMGRELVDAYPVFEQAIRRADDILRGFGAEWSLYEELVLRDAATSRVGELELSQPVTVALQLCLVDLLRAWGVTPAAVVSHSSGEAAAAYAVGGVSFAEALGVAFFLARLSARSDALKGSAGGMAAVGLGPEDVEKYIADDGASVVVAGINSPGSVTLAGDSAALDRVVDRLQADGVFARKLKVPLAYHSHHMQLVADEYVKILKDRVFVRPEAIDNQGEDDSGDDNSNNSRIQFFSSVTGGLVTSPRKTMTAEHFCRNMMNPVLFSQACDAMWPTEIDILVEIGPHSTLQGPIRQILQAAPGVQKQIPYASCLQRGVDALQTMYDVVVALLTNAKGPSYPSPVSLPAVNNPPDEPCSLVFDLPSYAWNHTKRYWRESRVSRSIRYPPLPRHELLGALVPACNLAVAPTWRIFLAPSEVDHWLRDPGTACAVMAIEAARLLFLRHRKESRGAKYEYRLRDIEIIANAPRQETAPPSVEVQIQLRPVENDEQFHFIVSSLADNDDDWTINAKGFISVAEDTDAEKGIQEKEESLFPLADAETTEVDIASVSPSSTQHTISRMRTFVAGSLRKKAIFDMEAGPKTNNFVIHPRTLDSVVAGARCAHLSRLTRRQKKMMANREFIVRRIGSLIVRPGGGSDRVQVLAEDTVLHDLSEGKEGVVTDIAVRNALEDGGEGKERIILEMRNFLVVPIEEGEKEEEEETLDPLVSKMSWEPDVLLSCSRGPASVSQTLRDMFHLPSVDDDEDNERDIRDAERKMLHTAYLLILDSLHGVNDTANWDPRQKKLYDWARGVVALGESGALVKGSQRWARTSKGAKQMLLDDLRADGGAWAELTIRMGEQLAGVLRGEVDPAEGFKNNNDLQQLLGRYYLDNPRFRDRSYKQLGRAIELFALKRPGADVLELGGGVGAATEVILEAFAARAGGCSSGRSLLGSYTFSDTSEACFDAARQRLGVWQEIMNFKPLDLEDDPSKQEFSTGSYDLIVASSFVFRRALSPRKALAYARKLLRPGGRLVMIETEAMCAGDLDMNTPVDVQLAFSTLFPEWWWHEDDDNKTRMMQTKTWDSLLRGAGFSGVDLEIGGGEHLSIMMASAASPPSYYAPSYPISIVHGTQHPPQAWLDRLGGAIRVLTGKEAIVESFDDVSRWNENGDGEDKMCIFTAELDASFVHRMDPPAFEAMKKMVRNSAGVLWLSRSGIVDADKPALAKTSGLLHTFRQVKSCKRIVQLDFSTTASGPWRNDEIGHIVDVFRQSFDKTLDSAQADVDIEYTVKDGMVYVPRHWPELVGEESKLQNQDGDTAESRSDKDPTTMATVSLDRPDATYLVIGGVTAIDYAICEWMIKEKGAKTIVLAVTQDARAAAHPEARALVTMARKAGADLRVRYCDASNEANMVSLLTECATDLPPVRGVVFVDEITSNVPYEYDQWRRMVDTHANLDAHLPDEGLDFLALLSQQGNNPFLDSLARNRAARGLPAVSVALSPSDVNDDVLEQLERAIVACRDGLFQMAVMGSASLDDVLPDRKKTDRRLGTLRLASKRISSSSPSSSSSSARQTGGGKSQEEEHKADDLSQLVDSDGKSVPTTLAEATVRVTDAVASKVASLLHTDTARRDVVDAAQSLARYGVDSLAAVELRRWLAPLRTKVSIFDILTAPSLAQFAALVVEKSEILGALV